MSDYVQTDHAQAPATEATSSYAPAASGLRFSRYFSKPGVNPFDELTWEFRDAIIQDFKGRLVFEQKAVEVPSDWSVTATNIVASKYLHGQVGTPAREKGVRDLISRVAESIRDWGMRDGYFASGRRRHLLQRAHAPARQPEGCVQLARLVQRRLRSPRAQLRRAELALGRRQGRGCLLRHRLLQAAVLGLLHQLGE